jgi:hypothetical protein
MNVVLLCARCDFFACFAVKTNVPMKQCDNLKMDIISTYAPSNPVDSGLC